jgi:hypothetical protein
MMMEAASSFEASINFYQITRRNNPEESAATGLAERTAFCRLKR